jgi:hypothetical protein
MKKIMLFTAFTACIIVFCGYDFINLPGYYYDSYDDFGGKNHLAWNAWQLETKHAVKTVIYNDELKKNMDLHEQAAYYFSLMKKSPDDRVILIYLSRYMRKGAVIVSDNLKDIMPQEYITNIEDDVIGSMMWRWYAPQTTVLAKVLGVFIYRLEKESPKPDDPYRQKDTLVTIDDPVYLFSKNPLLNDLIKLFFAEPLSFMVYFPFVTFFLFVRGIGSMTGRGFFNFMKWLWAALMVLMGFLIINRLNVFYAEYVWMFALFCGFNIPVYICLGAMYHDELEIAAYNYFDKITGGSFSQPNTFEGNEWMHGKK